VRLFKYTCVGPNESHKRVKMTAFQGNGCAVLR
jgi:hypothetical protein